MATATPAPAAGALTPRGFRLALAGAAVAGLAARVAYGLATKDPEGFTGDALWYHLVANNLADGHGYVEPFEIVSRTDVQLGIGADPVPTAFHLPLFPTVLAGFSLAGLDGETAHMLVGCSLGALAVVLVGVLGRRLAGPATGLAAAALAALYPPLVMNDSVLLSESLTGPTIAGALLAALWLRERPSAPRALLLGVLVGLAALNRSEAILLLVLLAIPAAVLAGGAQLRNAALVCVAALVTIAPWVIRNAVTFDEPTFLTTGDGSVLYGANCPDSYYGPGTGGWSFPCLVASAEATGLTRDESVLSARWRDDALDYARDNAGRVPIVMTVRVLRSFSLYPSPARQVRELAFIEDRPRPLVWVGLVTYAVVAIAAVAGALRVRRDRLTVVAMLAPLVLVVLTSAGGYGAWRFRQAAEVSLVSLAGVAVAAPWRAATGRAAQRGAPV